MFIFLRNLTPRHYSEISSIVINMQISNTSDRKKLIIYPESSDNDSDPSLYYKIYIYV